MNYAQVVAYQYKDVRAANSEPKTLLSGSSRVGRASRPLFERATSLGAAERTELGKNGTLDNGNRDSRLETTELGLTELNYGTRNNGTFHRTRGTFR